MTYIVSSGALNSTHSLTHLNLSYVVGDIFLPCFLCTKCKNNKSSAANADNMFRFWNMINSSQLFSYTPTLGVVVSTSTWWIFRRNRRHVDGTWSTCGETTRRRH